jgi:hypothetical protein
VARVFLDLAHDLDPLEHPEAETKGFPVFHPTPGPKAVEDYRTPRRSATLEAAGYFRQGVECGSPLLLCGRAGDLRRILASFESPDVRMDSDQQKR